MATVLDSFIITLGLDPRNFNAGQKAAVASFKKTQEEALRAAKDIESSGLKAAEGFSALRREIVGVGLALLGASSIKDFIAGTIKDNAELQRFSRTLGSSVIEVNEWATAAYLAGGSADSFKGSIASLVQEYESFKLDPSNGNNLFVLLRSLHARFPNIDLQLKFLKDGTLDWSDALHKVAAALKLLPPAQATELGRRFGFDRGSMQLFLGDTEGLLVRARALTGVTAENAAAAERVDKAWREAATAAQGLGVAIEANLNAPLERTLKLFTALVEKPKETLRDIGPGAARGALDLAGDAARVASVLPAPLVPLGLAALEAARALGIGSGGEGGAGIPLPRSRPFSGPAESLSGGASRFRGSSTAPIAGRRDFSVFDPEYYRGAGSRLTAERLAASAGSGGGASTSSVETNVGTVVVHTRATDAGGIAHSIAGELSAAITAHANNAPQ